VPGERAVKAEAKGFHGIEWNSQATANPGSALHQESLTVRGDPAWTPDSAAFVRCWAGVRTLESPLGKIIEFKWRIEFWDFVLRVLLSEKLQQELHEALPLQMQELLPI